MTPRERMRPGMVVRSSDGQKLGTVASIERDGFRLSPDGTLAPFGYVVDIRDDEVYVSTHRPDLGEARQRSPIE